MTHRAKTKKKDHRLSLRLAAADIAMIDRAARLRGQSCSAFVREAAVQAAEEVVMASALVRMSPAGFTAFQAAIAAPAAAAPAMVKLLGRTPPWERSGGN